MANKKILIVDDNADITEMVKTMLESSPYSCAIANSGEDCLRILLNQRFDLILLDIAMPEMSGIDVLTNMKTNNLAIDTKIVMFTASPMYDEMDLEKIRAVCGAVERVEKPFKRTELLAVISKYIG